MARSPAPSAPRINAKELVVFAHELADRAGAAILPHFRKALAVDDKGAAGGSGFDPVTAADKAAERVISRALRERFPDHGLVGEEYGERAGAGRYRWVVDPIDGTRAFIMGYPLWGTLIGVIEDDAPLVGVLDQPFTRERIWSSKDAAFLRVAGGRSRRISTRGCRRLADAVLSTTHPDLFAPGTEADGFARLKSKVRMTRYGGDCYAYAMLAAGFVDLVAEAGLKPYDIVALIPIIERAGGCITTWDGRPATGGGRILASGDPALHARALEVLSG